MKKALVSLLLLVVLSAFSTAFAGTNLSPAVLGASFRLPPGDEFWPGDTFYIYIDVYNPTEETFTDIPLFALWDVGTEWFNPYYWPFPTAGDWIPGEVHHYLIDVPPGTTELEILGPAPLWPHSRLNISGIFHLFTGMTNPFLTALFGAADERFLMMHM
jgi:hypothetical protein